MFTAFVVKVSVANQVQTGFEGDLYLFQEAVMVVGMDDAEVFAKGFSVFGGFDRAKSVVKEALM